MRALVFLLVLSQPASSEPTRISEGDWRELVQGRTLIYRENGVFSGLERYAPSGNRVEWQFPNGECTVGTWEVVEGIYCFTWERLDLQCYDHLQDGSRILVVGTDVSPSPGEVTEVSEITDLSIACGTPMS